MNPFETTTTVTTRFILPMIYKDDVKYEEIIKQSFVNSYISDYEAPEWDDKIIVICSEDIEPKNTKYSYIAKYKVNNDFVYVYDMLEEDKDSYYLIINDNYSLLNIEYKNKLLRFWDQKSSIGSLLHYTLYREMYDKLNLKEIRDLNLQLKEMGAKHPLFFPNKEIYWRE